MARGLKLDIIDGFHRFSLGDFYPDSTFIFDIDVERAVNRAKEREENAAHKNKEDRFERMDSTFHKNVRRGFLEIAKQDPERYDVV